MERSLSSIFSEKEDFFWPVGRGRRKPTRPRFWDRQQELPREWCAECGQEQYTEDPPTWQGLCPRCRRRRTERGECYDLTGDVRGVPGPGQVLQGRIKELKTLRKTLQEEEERLRVDHRIHTLQLIWREARDLAVLLEHYYERGYRRNGRYTL